MCCVWILAGSISDSRMLCTANKHCSLLCMAMSEMLLLWPVSMLHFTCYACWAALVTLMCCGWILAASISDSRTLCTADKHCSQLCMAMSEMLLLWPVSMLHFTCSACWAALVTLHVLCLDPCSKHIRQQNALRSRQALLSAVHGNVGDGAAVACVYVAFHVLCMLGCLGHTACAVSGSLQQAYQTAECFAQQTSIAHCCAWQCRRCCCCGLCLCCISCALHAGLPWSHCMCCVWILAASISDSRMLCTANKHCSLLCMAMSEMLLLWPVSMLHFTCYACWAALVTLMCCVWILAASIPDSRTLCTADKHCSQLCMAMSKMLLLWPVSMLHFTCSACWAALVTLHVLCLDPCSKHIRQQNALHSRQALLSAVHGNAGDAAAVACVYAAFHVLCMLGCLGHTDVLCLDPCSKHIRQQNALHSRQALLSAVHGNAGDAAAVACVYAAFHVLCMLGCLGHTACAVSGSLQQAYQTAERFAQQTSIALSCAWQCWRCCCCGLCLCCISRALHAGLPWSHCMCCVWILAAGISDSSTLCTADKHCSQLCMAMLEMLLLWPVSMLHFTVLCMLGCLGSHCMCCVWILAASISDSRMLCTADKHCSQLCMAMSEMVLLWPVSMLHFMCSACWAALVTLHVCVWFLAASISDSRTLCTADKHCSQLCMAMLEMLAAVACVYAAFHTALHAGLPWSHCMCCVWILAASIRQQNALHSRQPLLSACAMALLRAMLVCCAKPVSMLSDHACMQGCLDTTQAVCVKAAQHAEHMKCSIDTGHSSSISSIAMHS